MTKKKTTSTAAKKPAEKKTPAKKTAKKVKEKVLENEDNSLEIKKEEKPEDGLPADRQETEEKPEVGSVKQEEGTGLTVVIPFKASMAKGNELQYAVRAWEKHLPNVRIVVIGDSLPWFGKGIIHIEHKAEDVNPQVDVAQKMMAAIASDEVPESFIWSNDDIYPVSNLMYEDLMVLKANGRLGRKGTPGSVYSKNGDRTLAALKKAKIENPWDFATHTPVVLWKKELAEVIQQFNCDKEGHLVYTLYANTLYQGFNPIIVDNGSRGSIVASVYRSDPDKGILEKAFAERKFINNNDKGWPAVKPYLSKLFGEKSRFEK